MARQNKETTKIGKKTKKISLLIFQFNKCQKQENLKPNKFHAPSVHLLSTHKGWLLIEEPMAFYTTHLNFLGGRY
jgi:hypothetical protein